MKSLRHEKIFEIIGAKHIETQEELAECLTREGFCVTQATVSRDIRQLKLSKTTDENGKQYYTRSKTQEQESGGKYSRVLREGFVSAAAAENILVVKTVSGMAMAVAAALDHMEWPELAGTIAGDDTVFCAIKTRHQTEAALDKLVRLATNP